MPQPLCSDENGGGVRRSRGRGDCCIYNNKIKILIIKKRKEKKRGAYHHSLRWSLFLLLWMLVVVDVQVVDVADCWFAGMGQQLVVEGGGSMMVDFITGTLFALS